MPVRDSTAWRHARLEKKIINLDQGGDGRVTEAGTHYVICAWSDCTNDAFENHKVRINEAKPGYQPHYITYAFCSERCKQYWLHDSRGQGGNNLPPGFKRSIL